MSLAPDACVDDRPGDPSQNVEHSHLARALEAQPQEPPGTLLQRRREERGLSIEDLSRTTKINKATLRALESSDVLHLPAAIYTRGFVRAYAQEVGLNPEATAEEYLRRIEPLRGHHLLVDDGLLPPVANTPVSVDANDDARKLLAENQVRRFSRLTTLAAVIGLVVYLMSFPRQDDGGEQPQSATTGSDAIPDAARAASAERTADATPAALTGGPLRVELVTQGECWVAVSVDGERVLARLFAAGERQTLDFDNEAVLRIGEPGALTFSINGQSARPLGPAGQPVTVRITRDNFRGFLSS